MTKYRTFSGEVIDVDLAGGSVWVGTYNTDWYAGTATIWEGGVGSTARVMPEGVRVTVPGILTRCDYCNRLQPQDSITCDGCGAPL